MTHYNGGKRQYKILPAIFLLSSLMPIYAHCAAWVQEKGAWQYIFSTNVYESDTFFNGVSKLQPSGSNLRKLEFSNLIEYGLGEKTTVGLKPVMQKVEFEGVFFDRQCGVNVTEDNTAREATIIDADIFIRRQLWKNDHTVFSVQPLFKTPCLVSSEYGDKTMPGSADFELRILGGHSFKFGEKSPAFLAERYHFLNTELAYRKRGNRFSDQIRFEATGGLRTFKNTILMGQLFSVMGAGKETIRMVESAPGEYAIEKGRFHNIKLQFSAVFEVKENSSLQLGFFNDVAGKNYSKGSGLILSIWYDF